MNTPAHRRRVVLAVHAAAPDANADTPVLTAALRAAGADVDVRSWDDPHARWDDADVVHLHSPWNYTAAPELFETWLDQVADRLFQPLPVVRRNVDKRYLLELADRGVPVPATVVVAPGGTDEATLAAFLGAGPVVTKPAVGAGGRGCVKHADVAAAAHALASATSTQLAQSFVAEVATGELSAVVVDGALTHVVRKRPAVGEFRVQPRYGGSYELAGDQAEVPAEVLAAVPRDARYARVDYVQTADGPVVMELEMVEPELFLRLDARAAATVAASLHSAAG